MSPTPRALPQAPECFPLCRAAAEGHTAEPEDSGQAGSVSAGPRPGGWALGAPPGHLSSTSLCPARFCLLLLPTHLGLPDRVPPGGSGKLESNAAQLKSRPKAGAACARGSLSIRRMLSVGGTEGTRLRNSGRQPVGVHKESGHLSERRQGAVAQVPSAQKQVPGSWDAAHDLPHRVGS